MKNFEKKFEELKEAGKRAQGSAAQYADRRRLYQKRKIKITISGPHMTGKTVLAAKITNFLRKEGYTDVETQFGGLDVSPMAEPFASIPITIFEEN